MEEESFIQESCGRNHGGGIMGEEYGGGILGEGSWERNHGRGIMEKESWERDHGKGIMGSHLEAPGAILTHLEPSGAHLGGNWRHLGGSWGLSWDSRAPEGSWRENEPKPSCFTIKSGAGDHST